MNNELGRMCENVFIASFKTLFQNLLRGYEEKRKEMSQGVRYQVQDLELKYYVTKNKH